MADNYVSKVEASDGVVYDIQDASAATYIDTLPFNQTNATGDDSLVIGATAKAYSDNSVAIGDNTTAGCLGFAYKAYNKTGTQSFTLELVKADGSAATVSALAVNDEYSIKAGRSCNFLGKITAISGNTITFSTYKDTDLTQSNWKPEDHYWNSSDPGYLWIPTKVEAGTVKIGHHTLALGEDCVANETNTFVTGKNNFADGRYSAAFGTGNKASYDAFVNGQGNEAMGYRSHAEGMYTKTSGNASHADGYMTEAKGDYSVALGTGTKANGIGAIADGNESQANGMYSHASGQYSIAGQPFQTVVGKYNDNKSDTLFEVGNGNDENRRTNALEVKSSGQIIGGRLTDPSDNTYSLITKSYAEAIKLYAEGVNTRVNGKADKNNTELTGSLSMGRKAASTIGDNSIAAGYNNIASHYFSTALGRITRADGYASTTIGNETKATGPYSSAGGMFTKAGCEMQAAFGIANDNKSDNMLEVGNGEYKSKAQFEYDHSLMVGYYYNDIASHTHILITPETVESVWNNSAVTYVFKHSNALEVKKDGTIIGGRSTTNNDSDKTLVTKDYLNNKIETSGIPYTTDAPASANTDGMKVCILSSEPATKYSGWLYLITNNNGHIEDAYVRVENSLCFTAVTPNSSVKLTKNGTVSWTGNYSLDGSSWVEYTPDTVIQLQNIGDKVYFKGTLSGTQTWKNYTQFVMTGSIAGSGDVMSLHYGDVSGYNSGIISTNYGFYKLFKGCTSLTTAPKLPATTLTENCYAYMFSGCTSLTTAPALPATTLDTTCYTSMFSGCTSLTTAPALPATTLDYQCYMGMFYGCTSLTTAPALPATTLTEDCYNQMFYGCTSLHVADNQSASATHIWRIPTAGATLSNYTMTTMFRNCAGTRSTDSPIFNNDQKVYYVENEPV